MFKKNTIYLRSVIPIIIFVMMIGLFNIKTYAFNPNADDMTMFYQDKVTGIWVHSDCSQSNIDDYKKAYLSTPAVVRALLKKAKINIYILPYDMPEPENQAISSSYWPTLYETSHYGDAVTNIMRNGWIVCYGNLPSKYFNPQQLMFTMGKAIDNYTSYMNGHATNSLYAISDSEGWQKIYTRDNAGKLKNVWHMDELSELNWPLNSSCAFADAFRMYVVMPNQLKEASEDVYDFVDNQMTLLTSYYHMTYGAVPNSKDTMPAPAQTSPIRVSVKTETKENKDIEEKEKEELKQPEDTGDLKEGINPEKDTFAQESPAEEIEPLVSKEAVSTSADTNKKQEIAVSETDNLIQNEENQESTEASEVESKIKNEPSTEAQNNPSLESANKAQSADNSLAKQNNVDTKYLVIAGLIAVAILICIGLIVFLIKKNKENRRQLEENFKNPHTYTWQELYNMQFTGYKKVAGLYMVTGNNVHDRQFKPSENMFQDAIFEMQDFIQRQRVNKDRVTASLKVIIYPMQNTNFKSLEDMERKFKHFNIGKH